METISDRIKKMIQAHGLSQKDAAAGIGKTPQMMSHFLGQTDPPLDFVREICAYLKEPFYKAIMSAEELAALSEINPVISPIAEELNFAAENYNRTWQALVFGGIMAMLKKYRQMHESGEWK